MSAAEKLKIFLPLGINLCLSEIRKCRYCKGCYTSWKAAEKNAAGNEDIYTVQHIGEPIYKASYPLKIWGRGKLEKLFSEKYEPVCKWDCELTANASLKHPRAGRLKINDIGMMFQLKK